MGLEALCKARVSGLEHSVKAHLERDAVTVRGEARANVALKSIQSVKVVAGWLVLKHDGGKLELQLGAVAAANPVERRPQANKTVR